MVKQIKRKLLSLENPIALKMSSKGFCELGKTKSITPKTYHMLSAGDLVMRKQSAFDGGFAIVNEECNGTVGSQDLVNIETRLSKYFLWFLLRSVKARTFLSNRTVGVQRRVKIDDVNDFLKTIKDIENLEKKYD